MLYIIYAIHVIICLFLIGVVLLQQGSGADLSVFGGGGTQTAFGARSATSLLHKLTVAGFIGFILTTIAFGFLKSGGRADSVMGDVEQTQPAEAPLDEAAGGVQAPMDAAAESESGDAGLAEAPVETEPESGTDQSSTAETPEGS